MGDTVQDTLSGSSGKRQVAFGRGKSLTICRNMQTEEKNVGISAMSSQKPDVLTYRQQSASDGYQNQKGGNRDGDHRQGQDNQHGDNRDGDHRNRQGQHNQGGGNRDGDHRQRQDNQHGDNRDGDYRQGQNNQKEDNRDGDHRQGQDNVRGSNRDGDHRQGQDNQHDDNMDGDYRQDQNSQKEDNRDGDHRQGQDNVRGGNRDGDHRQGQDNVRGGNRDGDHRQGQDNQHDDNMDGDYRQDQNSQKEDNRDGDHRQGQDNVRGGNRDGDHRQGQDNVRGGNRNGDQRQGQDNVRGGNRDGDHWQGQNNQKEDNRDGDHRQGQDNVRGGNRDGDHRQGQDNQHDDNRDGDYRQDQNSQKEDNRDGDHRQGQDNVRGVNRDGDHRQGQDNVRGGNRNGDQRQGQNNVRGGNRAGDYRRGQDNVRGGNIDGDHRQGQNNQKGDNRDGDHRQGQHNQGGGNRDGDHRQGQDNQHGDNRDSDYRQGQNNQKKDNRDGDHRQGQDNVRGGNRDGDHRQGQDNQHDDNMDGDYRQDQNSQKEDNRDGDHRQGQDNVRGGNRDGDHRQGQDNVRGGNRNGDERQGQYNVRGGNRDGDYRRGQDNVRGGNIDGDYRQGQGNWRSGNRDGNYRRGQDKWRKQTDDSCYFLSKSLSSILRHNAEKLGFELMKGGFLYVDEILYYMPKLRRYTEEDIQWVVDNNDKKRFALEEEVQADGSKRLKIRANQGHSMEVEDLELAPITSAVDFPTVVHGTYYEAWHKIKLTGLKRMNRNHIHFAPGEPGNSDVISGMRKTCEVMIYIDLEKALKDGLKFFLSANNVILCPGNEHGIIFPYYFKGAKDRIKGQRLDFDDTICSLPKRIDVMTNASTRKANSKPTVSTNNANDQKNDANTAPVNSGQRTSKNKKQQRKDNKKEAMDEKNKAGANIPKKQASECKISEQKIDCVNNYWDVEAKVGKETVPAVQAVIAKVSTNNAHDQTVDANTALANSSHSISNTKKWKGKDNGKEARDDEDNAGAKILKKRASECNISKQKEEYVKDYWDEEATVGKETVAAVQAVIVNASTTTNKKSTAVKIQEHLTKGDIRVDEVKEDISKDLFNKQVHSKWEPVPQLMNAEMSVKIVEKLLSAPPEELAICCFGDDLDKADGHIRLLVILVNPNIYVYHLHDGNLNLVKDGHLGMLLMHKSINKVFHDIGVICPNLMRQHAIDMNSTRLWDIQIMFNHMPSLDIEDLSKSGFYENIFEQWQTENKKFANVCSGEDINTEALLTLAERGKLMLKLYNCFLSNLTDDIRLRTVRKKIYQKAIPEDVTNKVTDPKLKQQEENKLIDCKQEEKIAEQKCAEKTHNLKPIKPEKRKK